MKRTIILFFLVFLVIIPACAEFSTYYYWYTEFFNNSFFSDEKTATTALPIHEKPGAGKIEAMGTAYTASIEDGGVLQSNPSATSLLDHTELTFTHSNWIADSSVEQAYYTTRFDDFGFGFRGQMIYSNFIRNSDFSEADAYGTIAEGVVTANASFNLFSSYSFKGLAVGANIKLAFRNIPEEIAADQSALAIMGDIGLLTRFNLFKFFQSREPNFAVGLAAKNLGPPVRANPFVPDVTDPLPSEISAGVSYSPIKPLTVNLDFNLPFFLGSDLPPKKPDLSLGADLQFAPFLSLQAGLRYEGGNFRISLGTGVDVNDLAINVNYTHDFTTRNYSQELLDRISIQASINLGDRGRKALQEKVDEEFLAGYKAYQAGAYSEAIEHFRKALELDPSFDIAQRYLVTVQNLLDASDNLLKAGQTFFGDPDAGNSSASDAGNEDSETTSE